MENLQNIPPVTPEIVWAGIHELRQLMMENEQRTKKSLMEAEKSLMEAEKTRLEFEKSREKSRIEAEKSRIEAEKSRIEAEKSRIETDRQLKNLGKLVGGMGNSNGEMAEEYFFNSFNVDKTFANERYYKVRRNQIYKKEEIEAEFDLVLLNGKSAVLIEVKYNAKRDNVSIEKIISRIEYFKMLYPECKNFNIYLGVAAMSFKKGLEAELHKAGIATIRPVGKKMVKFDKDVKVF
jgi:hypothetical protein